MKRIGILFAFILMLAPLVLTAGVDKTIPDKAAVLQTDNNYEAEVNSVENEVLILPMSTAQHIEMQYKFTQAELKKEVINNAIPISNQFLHENAIVKANIGKQFRKGVLQKYIINQTNMMKLCEGNRKSIRAKSFAKRE